MSAALSDAGLPTDIAQDSERYIFILRSMADADPRKSALLGSYSHGFRAVFLAMTVISAAALLVSASIRRSSMDTVRVGAPQRSLVDSQWACRDARCNIRSPCPTRANQNIGK